MSDSNSQYVIRSNVRAFLRHNARPSALLELYHGMVEGGASPNDLQMIAALYYQMTNEEIA